MSEDTKADIKKPIRSWRKRKIQPSIGAARPVNKLPITENIIDLDANETEIEIINKTTVNETAVDLVETPTSEEKEIENSTLPNSDRDKLSATTSENDTVNVVKKRIPKRQRFTPTVNKARVKKEFEKPKQAPLIITEELVATPAEVCTPQPLLDNVTQKDADLNKTNVAENNRSTPSSSTLSTHNENQQNVQPDNDDMPSIIITKHKNTPASTSNDNSEVQSPVKNSEKSKTQSNPSGHRKKRYLPNLGPNVRQRSHPSYGFYSDEDGSQSEGYISDNAVNKLKNLPGDALPKSNPAIGRPTEVDITDTANATMHDLLYSNPRNGKAIPQEEVRDPSVAEKTFEKLTTAQWDNRDNDVNEPSPKLSKPESEPHVMAPQVKLGPDGTIILNEESLYIQQTGADKDLSKAELVFEEGLSTTRRKTPKAKKWGITDTLTLYKALSQVGTDFSLVAQMIPNFTRNQIKKKFKREEKLNGDLIDRALSNRLPIDSDMFKSNIENDDDIPNEE